MCSGLFHIIFQGRKGEKGLPGDRGRDIIQGKTGNKGATGQKGERGNFGPSGFTGPSGPDGFAGFKGEKGAPGKIGRPGLKVRTISGLEYYLSLINLLQLNILSTFLYFRGQEDPMEILFQGWKVDQAVQENMGCLEYSGTWGKREMPGSKDKMDYRAFRER